MSTFKSLASLAFLALASASPIKYPHHNIAPQVARHVAARDGFGAVTGAGLAWYGSNGSGTAGYNPSSTYNCYSGPTSNFPPLSSWMDFTAMFNLNKATSLSVVDTAEEVDAIYNGITNLASTALVDPRVILAVIMQESTGNVNVPCTNNGVQNCGLMQSYNSHDSFDPNNIQASVTKMIQDGTQGTEAGPGLVQIFNGAPDVGAVSGGDVYAVMRIYNSGSVDASNLSNGLGSTASYVSDIANRLQGWDGNGAGHASCGF